MSPNLLEHVRRFAGTRVLIIGEAMLDSYLHGEAERLSREAPVPIVSLSGRVDAPGGAANTAVNVATLGAEAVFLSVVGRDDEGRRLIRALEDDGVGTHSLLVCADRRTLAKERILAADQMLVRVDSGTTAAIDPAAEDALIERLAALYPTVQAVIVSDYDYGVMTPRVVAALAELAAADPRPLVVDARDLRRYRRLPVTAAKPNYAEAIRLLGEHERRGSSARAVQVGSAGDRLLEITGAQIVAVTVDADGVFVFERGALPYRTYCRPRADAQATGGGDTFVATLALALATGATTPAAAELASTAATVVVGKFGTATCSAGDLEQALSSSGKRISDRSQLEARVKFHRAQGARIVFTNGCFDILHRGHISYLNRAKALGDVLIVGVNADESVRRLKGPSRPINSLDDRLHVLEALSCIDHVVAFEEDTPEALLDIVRPDVFAKGGDYSRESLPEASLVERLGGTIQILPLVDDRSTTRIIARARSSAGDGSPTRDWRESEPAARR
jgi:D-beta-D-heptose 7-phosphate kinase/D-beta-D-heptose 1-phosphate adenosyltransferase